MSLIEQIISTIAPHYCLGCNTEGTLLCADCASELTPTPPQCYRCGALSDVGQTCRSCRSSSELWQAQALATYDGLAKELIGKLKFERAQAAAKDIARSIAARLNFTDEIIITHVPTANHRVRQRGYDQAQLIARELAREFKMPHATLLARTNNLRQLGATREKRREQLHDAFRPLKLYVVQNTHVLLVDDVITTGSTLESAAAILKAAGARRISAAVFARA